MSFDISSVPYYAVEPPHQCPIETLLSVVLRPRCAGQKALALHVMRCKCRCQPGDGCQYSQAPRVACFAGLSSTKYLRAICQPLGSTRLLWIQTVLDSMSLEGLAKVFSNDEMLRERVLTTGSLISWPSPKLVGVCKNKDALRLNSYILQLVADNWCLQWTSPAMIPSDLIKLEAPN